MGLTIPSCAKNFLDLIGRPLEANCQMWMQLPRLMNPRRELQAKTHCQACRQLRAIRRLRQLQQEKFREIALCKCSWPSHRSSASGGDTCPHFGWIYRRSLQRRMRFCIVERLHQRNALFEKVPQCCSANFQEFQRRSCNSNAVGRRVGERN